MQLWDNIKWPNTHVTGIFHARMGTMKDRNNKDLTEAEEIKTRWQKYTEELYKKNLNDPYNHSGVVIHLVPDIIESKVKVGHRKHYYKQSLWE